RGEKDADGTEVGCSRLPLDRTRPQVGNIRLAGDKRGHDEERAYEKEWPEMFSIVLMPHRLRPGTEIARNRDPTLEPLHGEHRDDVDDDVDDGRCRERFEDLEREFLHRTCACGECHQTDGERDGAV